MGRLMSGLLLAFLVHHVQGFTDDEPFFLVTSSVANSDSDSRIIRMDPYTYRERHIYFDTTLYRPMAVDFDPKESMIYWVDAGLYKGLRRAPLDSGKVETVLSGNSSTEIDGLAVDPVNRLIMYTDMLTNRISKMTINTFVPHTIIADDLDKPHAIVLHTADRVLFWSHQKTEAKIERASYDGGVREILVNTGLYYVNGLALDIPNNVLYWVDAGTDKIERCDLDGANRTKVLTADPTFHLFGMTLFEGSLYITDWTSNGSQTTSSQLVLVLPDEGTKKIVSKRTGRMNDIHVVLPTSAPPSGSQTVCVTRAGWTGTALLATLVVISIG